jgi:hypothetical protein
MLGQNARITVPVLISISRSLTGKWYGTGASGRAQEDPLVDFYGGSSDVPISGQCHHH